PDRHQQSGAAQRRAVADRGGADRSLLLLCRPRPRARTARLLRAAGAHAGAGGCAPPAVRVARLPADAAGDHGRRQAVMEITDSERWWWGVLLLSLALPVALLARGSARPWLRAPENAPALEDFGVVPDFALTERS